MREGDSGAQRLGSVESSATNERGLQAKRGRARGESHLLWKSETGEKKNTKRRRQKTRQRMTRRMMVLRGVDVLVGRKGGGSVGTWKPSSTQST
jgi:hypothetical protein